MSDKRRMFSATVVSSAEFVFMTPQAQSLYLQLCVNADDIGIINNARLIVRMTGVKPAHLDELCSNGFVIKLEENKHVITHWHVSNQIPPSKKKDSTYQTTVNSRLFLDDAGIYHLKNGSKNTQKSSEKAATLQENGTENTQKSCKTAEKTPENEAILLHDGRKNAQNFDENAAQYSIVEDSIDQDSIAHTSLNTEKAQKSCNFAGNVCENACVCGDSSNKSSDLCQQKGDKTAANNSPNNTKTDPPVDDLPSDTQLLPQELTAKAEEIRKKLKTAGLGVPDQLSWLQRDFKFALEGKRQLHLSDDEFFGALENYATLLAAKKDKPGAFWWDSQMPIPSLFKGNSPPVMRFLPYAFALDNFKTASKGKQGVDGRRGIDQSATYDAKEIAERQAVQFAEQDAMHDDAYYANIGF